MYKPNIINYKSKNYSSVRLIVHGQGVFVFDASKETKFTFFNKSQSDGLEVNFGTNVTVKRLSNSDIYTSQKETGGLVNKIGVYYWFSLDSQNQRLYAGIGEPRIDTVCYRYQFPNDKLWEANKVFLESLEHLEMSSMYIKIIRLLKNPINKTVPLFIKDTESLTMDDVAGTTVLPSAALSTTAQQLYNSICGKKFILNSSDFPEFSDAIEQSIKTPGLWCYERLKQKANEFGTSHPKETYLRITLGINNGESPGIPYVMEIWPVGHYSPVHNHGNAHAVIRVLHGSIRVHLYPYLCSDTDGVLPFGYQDFNKDDFTWLSPSLNQVHKLENLEGNKDTCITIQCYMYDEKNLIHYDYFDYLGDGNVKSQYEPDSDMDFLDFKQQMKYEWTNNDKN
jgi:hypothetical protein